MKPAALLLSLAPLCAQTVIQAAHYLDPATGTVTPRTLQFGGPARTIEIPDQSDQYVLPGLIDAHTHLCGTISDKWDLSTWIMTLQRRPGYRPMLDAGFTAFRDVGNSGDYLDADLEKAIRFSVIPGPNMIFAGQFWDTRADRKLLDNPEYAFADSHDEMRKYVRENIYMGARVINAAALLGLPNTSGLISVPGDPTKDLSFLKQAKVIIQQ